MAMQEYLICPRETFHYRMSGTYPDFRKKRLPELMAPAGSKEAFFAAVAAGADAVYLGGRRFGARHFAANFGDKEISEAVEYGHLHGVRVYVTVNTLIQDRELPDALEYLLSLYGMGVDAVLVQDLGLFTLARDMVPGLDLHASTQCTISSREGVEWAKRMGFSRVVLARETPLSEIDRILAIPAKKRPGIEIFIHGALCYSYSGQCLLSSVIGGRSGNRGMCAQPCRKPYQLVRWSPDRYARPGALSEVPGRDRYLLSTSDLCCYSGLEEIVARDLDALKIEGRMRSPEYVAAVVRAYRRALDALEKGEEWYSPADMDEMATAFNRGFTRGYLFGDRGVALMGRERPEHRGLLLGPVIGPSHKKSGFLVRPSSGYVPVAGDGILVVDPAGEQRWGYALNKNAELRGTDLFIPGEMKGAIPGSLVYLTRNMHLSGMLKKMLSGGFPRSGIPVDLKIRVATGEPLQGSASCAGKDGKLVRVACATRFIPEQAKTSPVDREVIFRQLQKTGETPFDAQSIDLDFHGDPFIPLGELNQLRRELFSMLQVALIREFHPDPHTLNEAALRVHDFAQEYAAGISRASGTERKEKAPPVLTVYCGTPDELIAACVAGCNSVCYEPARAGWDEYVQELVEGSLYCRERGVSFTWKWPRITGGPFITRALPLVPGLFWAGVTSIMVEELGMAEAILSQEPGIQIFGGQGLNIYNACAARALHPPIAGLSLSPELSSEQAAILIALSDRMTPGVRNEILCQGNLEAIVSEDTLLTTLVRDGPGRKTATYGLKDTTGRIFPIYEDRNGKTHILNAVETTLIDRVPRVLEMAAGSLAVDARGRGPAYTREMTGLYRESLEAALRGSHDPATWMCFKDRARKMARGGITAGHFERGVAAYSDSHAE